MRLSTSCRTRVFLIRFTIGCSSNGRGQRTSAAMNGQLPATCLPVLSGWAAAYSAPDIPCSDTEYAIQRRKGQYFGRWSMTANDPHQSVATSGANVCYVGTSGRRAADHHMTLYGEAWPHRFRTGRALIQCRVPGRRRVGTFEDRKLPILIGSEEPIPAIRVSTRREPWYRFETVPRSRS